MIASNLANATATTPPELQRTTTNYNEPLNNEMELHMSNTSNSDTNMTDAIRQQYAGTARSSLTNDSAGVQAVAEAFGYTADELTSIPAQANMGLSCGNPVATAHLKEGEVVVDLGSGGGLDVFLAAQKVGPTGKAIGIDMTQDMLDRATKAAATGMQGKPITNVEFHLASIDNLPLPDNSVDVILSNCVINLAPDKQAVFREMFRVLKPGGRVAVSDIALKQTLPDELAKDIDAYVGCIAGAIPMQAYNDGLHDAGFKHIAVIDANTDLNAYSQVQGAAACCSGPAADATTKSTTDSMSLCVAQPIACCSDNNAAASTSGIHDHLADLMKRYNINDYAASVKVFAIKPA